MFTGRKPEWIHRGKLLIGKFSQIVSEGETIWDTGSLGWINP